MSKKDRDSGIITGLVGDVFCTKDSIGDLNGKWAVMLKMGILFITFVFPLIMGWTIWVTSNIFTVEHHLMDTIDFRKRIVAMEGQLQVTPSHINDLSCKYKELEDEVKRSMNINTKEHSLINEQLIKLQARLER